MLCQRSPLALLGSPGTPVDPATGVCCAVSHPADSVAVHGIVLRGATLKIRQGAVELGCRYARVQMMANVSVNSEL